MKVLTFQVRSDAKIKNYNPSELSEASFSADPKYLIVILSEVRNL
jgi:hypothetical protein